MKASICCVVYGDFKYDNEDCEYEKALDGLNEYLIDLVKRGKLSANYKGKEVKIILPLSSWNVGNIFSFLILIWKGIDIILFSFSIKLKLSNN